VLLGSVPVLGLSLLFAPGPSPRPLPRLPSPAASPTGRTGPPAASGGTCNIAGDGTTTALSAVPADLSWVLAGGAVEPASALAGPAVMDHGVARCFAHDAEGALIASIRIQHQIAQATLATWPAAAAGLVPGPLTDALNAQMTAVLTGPPPPADTATPFAAIAGFRFMAYSPDQAVIELVYRTASGGLYQADQAMAWQDGDWRIALVGPDQVSSPQTAVRSLLGYVPWSQP
jgi:hypothetical protein